MPRNQAESIWFTDKTPFVTLSGTLTGIRWVRSQVIAYLNSIYKKIGAANRMFLIHLFTAHPGGVARAMWWPKEPSVSFIMFFKEVSLRWLYLRAKKLHSSSPVTSKLGSVNPRASSNLGSGILCSDPKGRLRSLYTGSGEGLSEVTAVDLEGLVLTPLHKLWQPPPTSPCGLRAPLLAWGGGISVTFWEAVWQRC